MSEPICQSCGRPESKEERDALRGAVMELLTVRAKVAEKEKEVERLRLLLTSLTDAALDTLATGVPARHLDSAADRAAEALMEMAAIDKQPGGPALGKAPARVEAE